MTLAASFIDFLESGDNVSQSNATFLEIAHGFDSNVWLAKDGEKSSILKQYSNGTATSINLPLSENDLYRYHAIQNGYARKLSKISPVKLMGGGIEYLGKHASQVSVEVLVLPIDSVSCREGVSGKVRHLVSYLPYAHGETLMDMSRRVRESENEAMDMDDGYVPASLAIEMGIKSALRSVGMPVGGSRWDTEGYPITHENIKLTGVDEHGVMRVTITDIGGSIHHVLQIEETKRKNANP